jgi:hypothetical protein
MFAKNLFCDNTYKIFKIHTTNTTRLSKDSNFWRAVFM